MSALAEQVVQAHQLDAELGGAGGRDVGVVGDQPDVERGEALRDELADLAEADDADGLAVELDAGVGAALPLPGCAGSRPRQGCAGPWPAAGRRRARRRRRCSTSGALTTITPRAVAAGTSTLSRPTPARATTLSRRAGGQRLGVDLGGRADEQRVRVGERGEQRGPVRPVDVADLDVVAEQRDRGRRELLGEQDDRAAADGGAHGGAVLPDRGRWSAPMVVGPPLGAGRRGSRISATATGDRAQYRCAPVGRGRAPGDQGAVSAMGVARLDLFGSASGPRARGSGDVVVLVATAGSVDADRLSESRHPYFAHELSGQALLRHRPGADGVTASRGARYLGDALRSDRLEQRTPRIARS